MNYLDFEIEIIAEGEGAYVIVARYAGQEHRVPMQLVRSDLVLREKDLQIALLSYGVTTRRARSPEEKSVQAFGTILFKSLFAGEVAARYDEAQSQARAAVEDTGVRLRLNIRAPELASLPWEFLYDEALDDYVCLSVNTPIVRYIKAKFSAPPPAAPPLKMLCMVVQPSDMPGLNVEREKQEIEKNISKLVQRGMLELRWVNGQSWEDLQQEIRNYQPHIFHFIGHGGFNAEQDQGFIALAEENGDTFRLFARDLARLLGDIRALRFVLLNACEGGRGGNTDVFSSTASLLVRRGIPAVLAMQYAIIDRSAAQFAETFYETLVEGRPVDEAVAEARKAVSIGSPVEWGTPVLYTCVPDGKLFNFSATARTPSPVAAPPPKPAKAVTKPLQPRPPAEVKPPRPASPNPETLIIEHPIRLEMSRIPAGEFLMGSNPALDQFAIPTEFPQHRLSLPDYYIGRYPITNGQFKIFVDGHPSPMPYYAQWVGRTIPPGLEKHPIANLSLQHAMEFCQWLSQLSGKQFILPTEPMWEKAARGSDGRIYPWGNQWDSTRLNSLESNFNMMTPVGHYSPMGDSPYGVADMCGNVSEWTASLWGVNPQMPESRYPYNPADGRENSMAPAQVFRVVRGGAFHDNQAVCRIATRRSFAPAMAAVSLGFRVAMVP